MTNSFHIKTILLFLQPLCKNLIQTEVFIKVGAVAQLVEQRTENPCVGGSIPPHTTKPHHIGAFFCTPTYKQSHLFPH